MAIQSLLLYRECIDVWVNNLCTKYPHASVIQISPNIPGTEKKIFPAKEIFSIGVDTIKNTLNYMKFAIIFYKEIEQCPFYISFFVVLANSHQLKKLCADLEEDEPLGRFWDIDVYKGSGEKLSRQIINYKERSCFLCSNPAKVCSFMKYHSYSELLDFIQKEYSKNI